uniref:Uncharacterized protein n=1 Tax=Ochrobactrum phage ORM_20 TaxID=2985243 RepID=A0A9N6WTI2_9VIRU|nr:hypothetical protein ORM20_00015 [Ochrobactrum phage ORM_20]
MNALWSKIVSYLTAVLAILLVVTLVVGKIWIGNLQEDNALLKSEVSTITLQRDLYKSVNEGLWERIGSEKEADDLVKQAHETNQGYLTEIQTGIMPLEDKDSSDVLKVTVKGLMEKAND